MERIKSAVTKIRMYLLVGGLALVVGIIGAFAISYQVMPIRTSLVQNQVIDLNSDGLPDFIVEAKVIFSSANLDVSK